MCQQGPVFALIDEKAGFLTMHPVYQELVAIFPDHLAAGALTQQIAVRGLRGRFGRQGSMALVSLAGPLSNVVLGACAAIALRVADQSRVALGVVGDFLWIFMVINFSLAAFNMIPVPPLDGSRILTALLPPFWRPVLAPIERYGIPILLLLLLVGGSLGRSIIGAISDPVFDLLMRIFNGR